MHPILDSPPISAALFHSRAGGFPLLLCTYVLLDADSNATADLARVAVVSVTALNGEHFRASSPPSVAVLTPWCPRERRAARKE